MATAATPSSLLSEEHLLCSICLDRFTQPVTVPCGHNFCTACIGKYWDDKPLCQCPMCKRTFDRRPELSINTCIAEIAAEFKTSVQAPCSDNRPDNPVSCDICTGTKLQALKSCLVCLTSFCETHLEPHRRVASLKRHKLMDPAENLEDRVCKKHERPLEMFCRTDRTYVCQFCTETDHKTHDTVPLEEESRERKTQLRKTGHQMIQERLEKVQKIKLSMETMRRNVLFDISDSEEIVSALVRSILRSKVELIRAIEEEQKCAEKQAKGFIKDLEKEIAELQRRSTDLERLSHAEDHLHFLQSFPSPSPPLPTRDWSLPIRVWGGLSVVTLVYHLEETLRNEMEKLSGAKLEMMQQYDTYVTPDSDTIHSWLILSEDRKQVRHADINNTLPDDPTMFLAFSVLGKQGFSSGRFYFEVQVKGETDWFVGVAAESVGCERDVTWSPVNGLWTVLKEGREYKAQADYDVLLSLRETPQKVGVFVDYEEGQVSFYDVGARSHIYSFICNTFTEKLYPLLNSCNHDYIAMTMNP